MQNGFVGKWKVTLENNLQEVLDINESLAPITC
jgi:hypothetical protein